MTSTLVERLNKRRGALDKERSSWVHHWRELADYILPRRVRTLSDDRNKGNKLNAKILDSTGTLASRTLASGMMTGITSPSRPWFRLVTRDPDLMEDAAVKAWTFAAENRVRQIFAGSNIYNGLAGIYEDLGVFGTAAMVIGRHSDTMIRAFSLPVGSYWLATGPDLTVDTLFREIPMTIDQMVRKFGLSKLPPSTRSAYDSGNLDAWHTVYQVIEPNLDRPMDRADAAGKAWRSVYWQEGETREPLMVSGFDEKPFLAPRWHVTGVDVYGRSPGMDALADIKQLQVETRRKGQAIDKMVNPPLQGPSSMQGQPVSLLPGAKIFLGNSELQAGGFRPIYEVRPDILKLQEDILEVQGRVRSAFYADLFLMLAESDRRQITATEIEERRSEKMLALGPVLERLQDELINPLVDIAFDQALENEMLPPPPPQLQGQNLRIELQSVLARQQRMDAVLGMDRLLNTVLTLAQAAPQVVEKIDADQVIDEYADLTGVPPEVVRSDDQVQQLRAERAQQEQAAQEAALAREGAAAAKDLAAADTEGKNALTDLVAAGGA